MQPQTLTSILKQRQAGDFVGRDDHITSFSRNLTSPLDTRKFVFAISGQAGIGKTFLLRRLRLTLENAGGTAASVAEKHSDVPTVLGSLVDQFRDERPFKRFLERFKAYRALRQEIEADAEAPPSLLGQVIGTATKVTLRAARTAPVVGAAMSLIDENAAASHAAELATYLTKKLSNKDDIAIVRDPIAILTPLFVEDLAEVESKHVGIFFDTFERNSAVLDPWLRSVLQGEYGDLSTNVIVGIAGQHELSPTTWAPLEGLLSRVSLDPFTIEETRMFLARRGITDPSIVTSASRISEGVPLLLATLSHARPASASDLEDPSETAVDRFLNGVDDRIRRSLAISAAVPREFDSGMVGEVLLPHSGNRDVAAEYQWLATLPFVEDGRRYHQIVRTQMLRHLRRTSPDLWLRLHCDVATYLEGQRAKSISSIRPIAEDILYHQLCGHPDDAHHRAVVAFVTAMGRGATHTAVVLEAVRRAKADTELRTLSEISEVLHHIAAALESDNDNQAVSGLRMILRYELPELTRAQAMTKLGSLLLNLRHKREALRSLDDAIALLHDKPTAARLHARAIAERASALLHLNRFSEAESEASLAIGIFPLTRAYWVRLQARVRLGEYDLALRDIAMMDTDPDDRLLQHSLQYERGHIFGIRFEHAAAADAYTRALYAESECHSCWTSLLRELTTLHGPTAAKDIYLQALSEPISPSAQVARADALASQGESGLAVTELTRIISTTPSAAAYVTRGKIYRNQRDRNAALADLTAALGLDSSNDEARIERATLYAESGDDRCLVDIELLLAAGDAVHHVAYKLAATFHKKRDDVGAAEKAAIAALQVEPDCEDCWKRYAEILTSRYFSKGAREIIKQSVIGADDPDVIAARGCALAELKYVDDALEFLTAAITHDPLNHHALRHRSELREQLGDCNGAAADMLAIAALSPAHTPRTRNAIGLALSRAGRYDEAIAHFEAARSGDSGYTAAYNLAVASHLTARTGSDALLREVTADFKAKLQGGDLIGEAHYALAGIAAVQGDLKRAMKLLRRAIDEATEAKAWARNDPAFRQLRGRNEFERLISLRR